MGDFICAGRSSLTSVLDPRFDSLITATVFYMKMYGKYNYSARWGFVPGKAVNKMWPPSEQNIIPTIIIYSIFQLPDFI